MKKALIATAAVAGAYLFSLRGRSNHPGMKELQRWSYAHRGLHGNGIPENSMVAFRAALEQGYGIELDIHLLKDGNLAVMHDSSLKRTAGADCKIEALTTEELAQYTLEGTQEPIPLFSQVLGLYAGKAPLIVELKPVGGNHAALADAAVQAMANYDGPYCMESFDPRCVHHLKKYHPQIIRGQLAEDFCAGGDDLSPMIRFCMTHNLFNFLTVPDFVAYRFEHRKHTPSNDLCRRVWDLQGVSWTIKTREDYDTAVREGWLPIFEGFTP